MILLHHLVQAFHTKGYSSIEYGLGVVGVVGSNPAAPINGEPCYMVFLTVDRVS